ncbi:MAG: hypothetical protein K9N23_03850 [Akkermansiaceae bacterium]|nr:hypothetical protein [Akkermansiaceae bacterium]
MEITRTRKLWACAVLAAAVLGGHSVTAADEAQQPADPNGILRKPIPDQLVVLTFDGGCASGYTVVKGGKANAFTWAGGDGKLGDATKWTNAPGAAAAPLPAGEPD